MVPPMTTVCACMMMVGVAADDVGCWESGTGGTCGDIMMLGRAGG